jgi:2-polyprenyl-6-methoxyphenol hydroxylase-like FAD-dependent oxidoreductase
MTKELRSKEFRVMTAGGGITRLTLANALQHANIDYILLEKRDIIDPRVSASISLVPNGSRILDQTGCYDDIEGLIHHLQRWQIIGRMGTISMPRMIHLILLGRCTVHFSLDGDPPGRIT